MFSWLGRIFKKPGFQTVPRPETAPSENPTRGYKFKLSVQGPDGERVEDINLVEVLAGLFVDLGREYLVDGAMLRDQESGLEFRPGVVSFQLNDDLRIQLCTTIAIWHRHSFPNSFFEYQHSCGSTGVLAAKSGFADWSKVDLPVLLDALEITPKNCTAIEIPVADGRARRVLLGPVLYWQTENNQPPSAESGPSDHSPSCPCCMFNRSWKSFEPLVLSGTLHAVRLYAMKSEDGTPSADCRINGEDFPSGQRALIAYATTWPSAGFTARKQYILMQDHPAGADWQQSSPPSSSGTSS